MALPVRTCALVGRFTDSRVAESAQALLAHLATRQVTVLVSNTAAIDHAMAGVAATLVPVPEEELGRRADLMVAVGGDGTLLYAAGLVARHHVPLLGINRGRLGFLTDVMPQDMLGCVDAALEGRLEADERPLLAARLRCKSGEVVGEALALNDVV